MELKGQLEYKHTKKAQAECVKAPLSHSLSLGGSLSTAMGFSVVAQIMVCLHLLGTHGWEGGDCLPEGGGGEGMREGAYLRVRGSAGLGVGREDGGVRVGAEDFNQGAISSLLENITSCG